MTGKWGSLRVELGLWVAIAYSILSCLGLVFMLGSFLVFMLGSFLVFMLGSFLAACALIWCLNVDSMPWFVLILLPWVLKLKTFPDLQSSFISWILCLIFGSLFVAWIQFMQVFVDHSWVMTKSSCLISLPASVFSHNVLYCSLRSVELSASCATKCGPLMSLRL